MDEIILAIINRNPTVCVLLSSMSESGKAKVRIGSNKEIKIPLSKIVERSGFEPDNANSLPEVTQEIKEIASEIQFEDIWYSVYGRQSTLTANEISTHLFDQKLDYKNIFAVWIKAYSDPIYFQVKNQDFLVNDKQTVQRILATKTKKQHEQNELNELIRSFNSGKLHETPSKNQLVLIEGLKKIAIYGSKSDKSPVLLQFIDKLKTHNSPDKRRKAFDNLVNIGLLSYDEPIELIQNKISEEFPRAVYEELEGANTSKPTCETRLDLTRLESFTIDDERTLDRDDAFSVEKDTIWIHITDMASIINDHPLTEEEAMGRAASLYLPELKIPMLPKLLSEETGSLNPGKIQPCISLKISLDGNGNIHGFNFEETMIKTTASFSYGQVDKILSSKNETHSEPFYKAAALADKYKEERISNGAISLDRPEMTIELNKQMKVAVRLIEKESKSRSMIENLMVLYNCLAGKFCEENKVPVPFRLQSRPNIPPNQKIPSGQLGWYMLSKMLRPARLSLDPGRHHGLGVDNYVQVTSPIRRYNDLVTQKQLKNAMRNLIPPYSDEEILNISTTAQKKIRLLHTIENIRKKYWFLKFLELEKLQGRNIHRAIVLDNNRNFSGNSLIELEKYPFKGRCSVPSHVMGGSTINVELLGIDLWEKSADFRMVKI